MDDWLADTLRELRKYKQLADRAIVQLPAEHWFTRLDPESNSVALLMKHMAGNMRSRWTDFLITDGEKPDRHRDAEFEEEDDTQASILARWEDGWSRVEAAVEPLEASDLSRTVSIRGEPHTVQQAIQRQLTHYAYHVGQIVFLVKHLTGPPFQSLSIPRGRSAEFDVTKAGSRYLAKDQGSREDS